MQSIEFSRHFESVILRSLVVSFLISAGISWTVPINVIDTFPLLDRFCQLMRKIVPSIDAIVEDSLFPQVSSLALSALWSTTPWHVIRLFKLLRLNRRLQYPGDLCEYGFKKIDAVTAKTVIVILTCWLIVYVLTFYPPRYPGHGTWSSNVIEQLRTSRISFGAIAGVIYFYNCLILALAMELIVDFRRIVGTRYGVIGG